MIKSLLTTSVFLVSIFTAGQAVAQLPGEPQTAPVIEELGEQRYRIAEIEVDKAAGEFTVAGTVLRDEPPLEFLVIANDSSKGYESLLAVNADAFEFNLACILIGLDTRHSAPPEQRVDGEPMKGDPVEVTVSWLKDGKRVSVDGTQLLLLGDAPKPVASRDWVYTGSADLPDGRYLAALSGILIGFFHRDESIIEHKQGLGLGNYGAVLINTELMPAVGTPIELTVRNLAPKNNSTTKK